VLHDPLTVVRAWCSPLRPVPYPQLFLLRRNGRRATGSGLGLSLQGLRTFHRSGSVHRTDGLANPARNAFPSPLEQAFRD